MYINVLMRKKRILRIFKFSAGGASSSARFWYGKNQFMYVKMSDFKIQNPYNGIQ